MSGNFNYSIMRFVTDLEGSYKKSIPEGMFDGILRGISEAKPAEVF